MYSQSESPNGGEFKSHATGKTYTYRKSSDDSDRRRALRDMQADDAKAGGFKVLNREERRAQRLAEQNGRLEAAHVQRTAEREAAANAPPTNPFRGTLASLQHGRYTAEGRRRYERAVKWADEWDAKQAAEQEVAEREAAVAADPFVRTSREFVANWGPITPAEFRLEAAAVAAFANTSPDGVESWARIDALREKIAAAQDRETALKMAEAGASREAFEKAAAKSEADRATFEAARPKPEPSRDDAGKFK